VEYRRLGRSGLLVSALSLGSWTTYGKQVGADVAEACVTAAWEAGVNLFDTAEGYADGEAERILGAIFRTQGWPRERLVVCTKVFFGGDHPNQTGLSAKHVIEGCHGSLRRLGLDHLDLLLCHRPDPNTPVEETVRAMDTLVRQGKVLYWGTSEWDAGRIRSAVAFAHDHHLTPPCVEQTRYSLANRRRVEGEHAPLYADPGIGLLAYSALEGGLLTGKYLAGVPEGSRAAFRGPDWVAERIESPVGRRRADGVRALSALAEELGVPTGRLALAWCLKNPHVSSVITGATAPAQLADNLRALDLAERLTPEVTARAEAAFAAPQAPPA
jgi:voltage-dependent potassium channel beta subunit